MYAVHIHVENCRKPDKTQSQSQAEHDTTIKLIQRRHRAFYHAGPTVWNLEIRTVVMVSNDS